MTDRIYATYKPTIAPESYHIEINYERRDVNGKIIMHRIIDAGPQNDTLLDKIIGAVEEKFGGGNGSSRFGNIVASVREPKDEDKNLAYEPIAEGADLSTNWTKMQLFAHGVNRAGIAYRGEHQNSNSFASALLRAGELPPATGVAHDPAGLPGELLDFFAPGLDEPLRPPVGQRSSNEPVRGVQYASLPELGGEPFREYGANTTGTSNAFGTGFSSQATGDLTAPGRGIARPRIGAGQFVGPVEEASLSQPMLQGPTAPNFPSEESGFGDRSESTPGAPRPDTYPQLRRVSSAFTGIAPPELNGPVPPPERAPLIGIFSGKPMSFSPFPLPLGGLRDNSDRPGDGNLFDFLASLASGSQPPAPPPSAGGMPVRTLGRSIVDQPQASASDTGEPAAPLAPSDDANFSGGLLGRLAALAGLDPRNPTQLAPPPLDDELRGFYGDNPVQPWFVQGRR
jgi:hypothetical protein